MRYIQLEDALRIRFPNRSDAFDEGVEVGMVAALMAVGVTSFNRWVSRAALEQLATLAPRLNYRLTPASEAAAMTEVQFERTIIRPRLAVVR